MSKAISSSPPPCKGTARVHAYYGCSSGLIHGLASFCCEIPLPQCCVFLGAAHKSRRNLYMEISPATGNISPCTCPSKRSTASIIAFSTWNVVTSPHFMTKHSLCHCSRVEQALTALTYGPLSTAFVTLSICIYLEKSYAVFCSWCQAAWQRRFVVFVVFLLFSFQLLRQQRVSLLLVVVSFPTLLVLYKPFLEAINAHCKLNHKMLSASALLSSRDKPLVYLMRG